MARIAPHLTPGEHKQPRNYLDGLAALQTRIADRAVTEYITSEAVPVGSRSERLYDVRPMLDLRERSGAGADVAAECLAYALIRGLATQGEQPWLVRIGARA